MSIEVVDLLEDTPPGDIISIDDDENEILCDMTYREHELFSTFVNKCLSLSDSKGIIRVLNKILLPAFKKLDESYKQSKRFDEFLIRTISLIDADPSHKFSYLKDLYETLKFHKIKKKVEFVTLTNKVKEKTADDEIKRKTDCNINSNKKPRAGTSSTDCDNTPVIDLNKYEHDIFSIKKESAHTKVENNDMQLVEDIVHVTETMSNVISKCDTISPNPDGPVHKDKEIYETQIKLDAEKVNCDNTLWVPKIVKVFHKLDAKDVIEKSNKIEKRITMYKRKIAILEEQEVNDDTNTSPYILCERYKARIVALYKEWCDLTGRESVKRSEVKLNVQDGHPPGPVQRLEKLLNDNIGTDGHPPFPDFQDVMKCVIDSNIEDELGWKMSQILREARALFTQCGRALQLRRQKREWRFLLSRVKEECDEDPAIINPELEARLRANRVIALKKEAEILERFSIIESMPSKEDKDTGEGINQNLERNSSDGSVYSEDFIIFDENLNFNNTMANENEEVIVKEEPEDIIVISSQEFSKNSDTVQDIEDPTLVIEILSDSCSDDD